MSKDIKEIKITLVNIQKSIDIIIQCELRNIDKEMNTLLIELSKTDDIEKANKIEKKLAKLSSIYTDLFLAKFFHLEPSEETEE